jgi:hypothetical protein
MSIFQKHHYRWYWGTLWLNLWHYPVDFWQGLRNWFRWAPVIWHDKDWDWSYLARVLEYKFDRMARSMDGGCIVNNEKYARQIRECRDLVHRLRKDKYFENAEKHYSEISPRNTWIGDRWVNFAGQHSSRMHQQDQERLGLLISRYMTHWWW